MLKGQPWQAAWLVSTPEFRRAAFQRRCTDQQFWRRTSDPAAALEALLRRDAMFADVVRREARELGLRIITVNGSRSADDVSQEVADWFRLDATTGVQ